MTYLLEADAVFAALHNQPAAICGKLDAAKRDGAEVAISAITLFQLRYRITQGPRRFEVRARLRDFLADAVAVLAFDADDAAMAGELQFALAAAGTPIGPYDLLIAAQALRRGATLATISGKEFARIPGLDWQNWSL